MHYTKLFSSPYRLKLTVSRNQPQTEVVDVITQLGATFTKLIELMLSKEIKVSYNLFNESKSSQLLQLDEILSEICKSFQFHQKIEDYIKSQETEKICSQYIAS